MQYSATHTREKLYFFPSNTHTYPQWPCHFLWLCDWCAYWCSIWFISEAMTQCIDPTMCVSLCVLFCICFASECMCVTDGVTHYTTLDACVWLDVLCINLSVNVCVSGVCVTFCHWLQAGRDWNNHSAVRGLVTEAFSTIPEHCTNLIWDVWCVDMCLEQQWNLNDIPNTPLMALFLKLHCTFFFNYSTLGLFSLFRYDFYCL